MSQPDAAPAPVVEIDGARLIDRLRRLAAIGARPEGGLNRQAFTPEEGEARRLVAGWAREIGMTAETDAIGNLYLRYAPAGIDGPAPVLGGSHLDTQPAGGWLDGAYGVIAALEAVQAIKEQAVPLARPLEVVAWVNEEGSRFQPGVMGSAWFVGHFDLARAPQIEGSDGTALDHAIVGYKAATPDIEERETPFPIAGLIEAHIEQGPILESEGLKIGVVEGVQGIRWFRVEVLGEAAHAGTTPLGARRDAVLAATRLVQALSAALADPVDVMRFTVGRFVVSPGSPNTVAAKVTFTIDLRHPDTHALDKAEATIREVCAEQVAPCEAAVTVSEMLSPVAFDERVVAAVAGAAEALGMPFRRMASGAGHDAANIARVAPAGMVFVPCHGGVSHHPAENADEADLIAGAHVVATAMARLAAK